MRLIINLISLSQTATPSPAKKFGKCDKGDFLWAKTGAGFPLQHFTCQCSMLMLGPFNVCPNPSVKTKRMQFHSVFTTKQTPRRLRKRRRIKTIMQ